jgi:hypothetical protein
MLELRSIQNGVLLAFNDVLSRRIMGDSDSYRLPAFDSRFRSRKQQEGKPYRDPCENGAVYSRNNLEDSEALLVVFVRYNAVYLYLDQHRTKYRRNLRLKPLFSEGVRFALVGLIHRFLLIPPSRRLTLFFVSIMYPCFTVLEFHFRRPHSLIVSPPYAAPVYAASNTYTL